MIDMNPKEGRIVMRDSMLIGGQCSLGGKITRVSGKRVYYQPMDRKGEVDLLDEEKFTQKPTAICDTMEEVTSLLAFSKKMTDEMFRLQRQLNDLQNKSNSDWKKIIAAGTTAVLEDGGVE